MRTSAAMVILATLGTAVAASAEPPPAWGVSTQLRLGSTTAPFYSQALSETSSEVLAKLFIFEGFYRPAADLQAGVRLPLSLSAVLQPGGSYSAQMAIGNPELYIEHQSLSWELAGATVHVPVRAAVGIPVAQHGPGQSLLRNRVLALAGALDGWRNPELWEPGLLPVTLSARAVLAPEPWGASLAAKIPVLIRVGNASLPEESKTRAIGVVPTMEAQGTWQALVWLAVHVAGVVVFQIAPAASPPKNTARSGVVQLMFTPSVDFRIGERWLLSVDVSTAIGGPLSGTFGLGMGLAFHP